MKLKGKEIKCAICEKMFYVKLCDLEKRKTCSIKCKSIYIKGNNNPYIKVSHKYTGENSPLWKEKVKKVCIQCNDTFYVKPSHAHLRKSCSKKCYSLWMSVHNTGENNPNYGKSIGALDKNPNWKGGLSFLSYPPVFNKKLKQEIKDRDGYNCKLCYKSEEQQKIETNQRLPIHHIDYNKQNCDPLNLTVLCVSCNSKVNFKREYYTQLLSEMVQNSIKEQYNGS